MTSDFEFFEIVQQILNFILPKHLAEDLGVSECLIEEWAAGNNLPKENRDKLFHRMVIHDVWDDMT